MLNFKPPMERNIGELQLEQAYNSKQQCAMTSSYRLCIEASNTSLGLNASSLAKQTPWSCTNLLLQLRCQTLLVASGATGKKPSLNHWTECTAASECQCLSHWMAWSYQLNHRTSLWPDDRRWFPANAIVEMFNFKPPMERNIICSFFAQHWRPKRCDYVDRSLQATPDWWFQPTPKAYIQKHWAYSSHFGAIIPNIDAYYIIVRYLGYSPVSSNLTW